MRKIVLLLVILAFATAAYATDTHVDSIEVMGPEEAFACPPPPAYGCPGVNYVTVDLPWKYDSAIDFAVLQDTSLVLHVTTEETTDPEPETPWQLPLAFVPIGTAIPSGYTRLSVVQFWTGEERVACIGAVIEP